MRGYNIEISINMIKETKYSEIESMIQYIAKSYDCDDIYCFTEEDGSRKIPRYHCIYSINFLDENFNNLIKFLKNIKQCKSTHIECIYNNNNNYKLLYASSYYLNNIDREVSKKYKQFIKDKQFTPNESILLKELI
jgi:hypothetical protein